MQVRRMLLTTGIGVVSTMLFVMADTVFAGHLLGEPAIAAQSYCGTYWTVAAIWAAHSATAISDLRFISRIREQRLCEAVL